MRREALLIRVEVGDLRRRVSQRPGRSWGQAGPGDAGLGAFQAPGSSFGERIAV